MDLNELLWQHQLALMAHAGARNPCERDVRSRRVSHSRARIDQLRQSLGVARY